MNGVRAGLVVLALALAVPVRAQAVAEDERVGELERLVHELRARVDELERQLASKPIDAKDAVPEPAVAEAPSPEPRVARADDGRLGLRSSRTALEIELGARFEIDAAFAHAGGEIERRVGDLSDRAEVRRARLSISGTVRDRLEFQLESDFAEDGTTDLADAWVGLRRLPHRLGLRIGHLREPFGLEELGGSRWHPFQERSLATALAPGRNVGVIAWQDLAEGRFAWSAGAFRETDEVGRTAPRQEDWQLTARVSGLPWRPRPDRLVHLGISRSWRHPDASRVTYAQPPESNAFPDFVDTRLVPLDGGVELSGYEAAWMRGPAWVQAELVESRVEPLVGPPLTFVARYAQAGWFLTGEHRAYDRREGTFGRVAIERPAWAEGPGCGAWEIAARWSAIDLDERFASGGHLEDFTLGLNWWLDRHVRVSWNVIRAQLEGFESAWIGQVRLQLAF